MTHLSRTESVGVRLVTDVMIVIDALVQFLLMVASLWSKPKVVIAVTAVADKKSMMMMMTTSAAYSYLHLDVALNFIK